MSRPSASATDLVLLKEDLAFHEGLLKSLEDQPHLGEQTTIISEKVKALKRQISKMQYPLPDWGSSNNHSSFTNIPQTDGAGFPYSSTPTHQGSSLNESSSASMTLPSRKRPRNAFDDEFDQLHIPETKSHRAPTLRTDSPARSIDSFGTDLSDDPALRRLLGNNYRDEKLNNEQYLRNLEVRKRQEEEDAEYARQLQEEWDDLMHTPSVAQKTPAVQNNLSQSFLRHDGLNFQKPAPQKPPLQKPVPSMTGFNIKPEHRVPQPMLSSTVSGTSTPSSDDSGLVEISSNDWANKFGRTQRSNFQSAAITGYPSYNNSSVQMPGSFPSFNTPFASTPGVPVYGRSVYGTNQYNSATSSLGNTFNPLLDTSFLDSSFPGSSRMPFDLEKYPLPSSLHYADPEQTQEEIIDLLKHIRPDDELTPEQLAEIQPEGLKINLMPHQRKGYAWMKSMEEGTNKGGILADDMGLGKTVQALALILGRPPVLEDGRRAQKPTLIVAPVALMEQWEREIKKMVHRSHHLNVLILHGGNRNQPWSYIKSYDVVLTTYGLLASDLKRKDLWDKHVKMVPDATPKPQQQCPVLSERSKFHRVILDEAQNIKNKSTKAAAAACRIQSDYRWCLSGTPMQNNVDEIFSLIKFCRIRPYSDYEKFSKDIGRPLKAKGVNYGRDKAMKQLQALLRAVLLRRTKKSKIDGQPIIQLPEKYTVEDRAVFTKDELDFYKALETSAQIQFNRFLKNGTVGRHYSHALVLLLRLRQCCCSPQLITNAKDFLVNGALQDLDYVENARLLPKDVIRRLSEMDGFECPICMDGVENPVIFNPCGHSLCQECLSTMVDKALADTESHKVTCPHCRADIDTNKVSDYESFLRVHFPDRPGVKPLDDEDGAENEEAEGSGSDSSDTDSDDEDDGDDGADLKDFIVPDEEEVEDDTDASGSTKKGAVKKPGSKVDTKGMNSFTSKTDLKPEKKHKSKGKKKSKPDTRNLAQLRVEGLKNKAAKKKYLRRLGRGFQTSTKIEKTIEILKKIKDNGEGEKTIIFSSFTSFLDLLEVAMIRDDDDFGTYTRYDGSMSAKNRNESVIRFTDDPKCTAILVSLKAGNAGLNLTAANHVIILDPFWNPFVEHQAADRCYRIGQLREVTVHRVLIGEGDEDGNLIEVEPNSERVFTVEDRILALQAKKQQLVEAALDEKAAGNIGRLGVRELGYLFGVNSMAG